MKKYLSILFAVLSLVVFNSCSKDNPADSASKSPEFLMMEEHTPSKVYLIDVKTKLTNKIEASGTKNGAIAYLNNQEWCKVVETGENYSLWIKDLSRDTSNFPNITIGFNLELQEYYLIVGRLIPDNKLADFHLGSTNFLSGY